MVSLKFEHSFDGSMSLYCFVSIPCFFFSSFFVPKLFVEHNLICFSKFKGNKIVYCIIHKDNCQSRVLNNHTHAPTLSKIDCTFRINKKYSFSLIDQSVS